MRKNDLIKLLQDIPGNPVMVVADRTANVMRGILRVDRNEQNDLWYSAAITPELPGPEENRTTHRLYYVALQVQTFKAMHTGSKQVPGFWVEAVNEHEARTKAADIINTLAGYSHGQISSCDPKMVIASLLWTE